MAGQIFRAFVSLIKRVSVEPVLILNALAMSIYVVPYQIGLYHVVCQDILTDDTFRSEAAEDVQLVDCWSADMGLSSLNSTGNSSLWNRLEIQTQEAAAGWTMAFSLAYTLPCLFSDVFLGAYGDSQGRKYNIMCGLVGLIVSMTPWAMILAQPSAVPLFVAVIGDTIAGLTGYLAIITISAAAYIADTVTDSGALTLRMTILVISVSAPGIVGPLIAKGLLGVATYSNAVLAAAAVEVSAVAYAAFALKQVPPKEMRKIAELKASGAVEEAIKYEKDLKMQSGQHSAPLVDKLRIAFFAAIELIKAVWRTFTKKRQGHRRIYLLILSSAVFFSAVTDAITHGMVMTLFVQKAPFRWNKDQISNFKSLASALSLVGTTFGIVLFKKRFHLPDTLIIISLISHVAKCLITAFSDRDWMLFMAAGSGVLLPLLVPCAQSFVAKIVDADEVGKSFSAFTLGTNLAYFANLMIFVGIYRATVAVFARFVYLLTAILLLMLLCLAIWVHIDYNSDHAGFCSRKKAVDIKTVADGQRF